MIVYLKSIKKVMEITRNRFDKMIVSNYISKLFSSLLNFISSKSKNELSEDCENKFNAHKHEK